MARKTKFVTITDRGVQKKFLITEMSASELEKWAVRLVMIAAASAIDLPDDLQELKHMGVAGLMKLVFSSLAKIPPEKIEPFMDRLMECVQIVPDPRDERVTRPVMEEDIDDFLVRLTLKKHVWELHTDFLRAAKT